MACRIGALTLLMTAIIFAACGDANSGAQDLAAEEIAERVAGYVAAIERGDVDAAADYWTEDARLIGPGFDLDRSEVLEGMRAMFGAGMTVAILGRPTLELFAHGNVAYEIAQATEVFVAGTASPPDTTRHNMFIRWERGPDGVWRFDRAVLGPQETAPR